jgi:hypothetical protein
LLFLISNFLKKFKEEMMETNALPKYDMSDNPTGCCPRFKPEGWDEQELHFKDKLFIKAKTRSIFHIPINMGSVFPRTFKAIEKAEAQNLDQFIVLSYDPSAWHGEHYFAVTKEVPEQEMARMTGDFLTKVFEGPYKNAPKWEKEMETFVISKGKEVVKTYFFYTTCPKCAKFYGKNYLVAVSEIQ